MEVTGLQASEKWGKLENKTQGKVNHLAGHCGGLGFVDITGFIKTPKSRNNA